MTEKKIKTHTVLAAIFILTTFVTACVKNSGKGPGEPEVVQSAKIDSEHLNPNGEDGTIRAIIQADLTNPTEVISKDFTIQLNEISEVQVRRGAVNNENCGKNDLATYEFYLVSPRGDEKMFQPGDQEKMLMPGNYQIRVRINNVGLCRKISMDFDVVIKSRKDLTLTQDLDMSFTCHEVIENDKNSQNKTEVHVKTRPLVVNRHVDYGGDKQINPVINELTFCERQLTPKALCGEGLTPIEKRMAPMLAKKRSCLNEGTERVEAHASLQVFEKTQEFINANVACQHQHNKIKMQLDGCEINTVLGTPLPAYLPTIDMQLTSNEVKFNFNFVENANFSNQLGEYVHVMIYSQSEKSEMYILNDTYWRMPTRDFTAGKLTIGQPGLLTQMKKFPLKTLKVVWSKEGNAISGVHVLSLAELCQYSENENTKASCAKL